MTYYPEIKRVSAACIGVVFMMLFLVSIPSRALADQLMPDANGNYSHLDNGDCNPDYIGSNKALSDVADDLVLRGSSENIMSGNGPTQETNYPAYNWPCYTLHTGDVISFTPGGDLDKYAKIYSSPAINSCTFGHLFQDPSYNVPGASVDIYTHTETGLARDLTGSEQVLLALFGLPHSGGLDPYTEANAAKVRAIPPTIYSKGSIFNLFIDSTFRNLNGDGTYFPPLCSSVSYTPVPVTPPPPTPTGEISCTILSPNPVDIIYNYAVSGTNTYLDPLTPQAVTLPVIGGNDSIITGDPQINTAPGAVVFMNTSDPSALTGLMKQWFNSSPLHTLPSGVFKYDPSPALGSIRVDYWYKDTSAPAIVGSDSLVGHPWLNLWGQYPEGGVPSLGQELSPSAGGSTDSPLSYTITTLPLVAPTAPPESTATHAYTFALKDGSTTLDTATCNLDYRSQWFGSAYTYWIWNKLSTGSLACSSIVSNSVSVDWSYGWGKDVSLFRDGVKVEGLGTTPGYPPATFDEFWDLGNIITTSGTHIDTGLSPGAYLYRLTSGPSSYSPVLGQVTCTIPPPSTTPSGGGGGDTTSSVDPLTLGLVLTPSTLSLPNLVVETAPSVTTDSAIYPLDGGPTSPSRYTGWTTIATMTVKNNGSVNSSGTFTSQYKYLYGGNNTSDSFWTSTSPSVLGATRNLLTTGTLLSQGTRGVPNYQWIAGEGVYAFALCADAPPPGTVTESSEVDNCSPRTVINFHNPVLSIHKTGNSTLGTVTSAPVNVNCGPDCSEGVPPSANGSYQTVTVTMTPAVGSRIKAGSISGTGLHEGQCTPTIGANGVGSCSVLMNQDRAISVEFEPSISLLTRPTVKLEFNASNPDTCTGSNILYIVKGSKAPLHWCVGEQ